MKIPITTTITEQSEFFGFSSEVEIKSRRAEMLLTLSPGKTKTLDDVAHNLNENVEDYKCSEYERDLFMYDAFGQPVFEDGNDSWRAQLTNDVRFNRVHYISSKKMCNKASCRTSGRHKCKCPLLPEVTQVIDIVCDIVCDIVAEAFSRITPNEVDNNMVEELAAAEFAEEDIENEIIAVFKPDINKDHYDSAMVGLAALAADEPIWKPQGRWPADMMAEHDVNVALKEYRHAQNVYQCDCCKQWKYIVSNIEGNNTCKKCNELTLTINGDDSPIITGTADDLDPFATDDEDATDDDRDKEFADHVLKLMVPGREIYLTTRDINKPGKMWRKSDIHHAVTGCLPFRCEKAPFKLERAGERLLFTKSEAERLVESRLGVIEERKPEQRNPVIAILDAAPAPNPEYEKSAPKKKKRKVTKKKVTKKNKVTNGNNVKGFDLLTNAMGGKQVCRHELGEETTKANGKRGRTIYCCPEEGCEMHRNTFQRVDHLIRHLHEKHNYDVLDEEGNVIPRQWHVCVDPDCTKKNKRFHNTNQYVAHMLCKHTRRIVKSLDAEGKHKKSSRGYSIWHFEGHPKCTVERYQPDCGIGCDSCSAQ